MSEDSEKRPWSPTEGQIARANRSILTLRHHCVPMLENSLLYTADDKEVTIRTGPEVARRTLVLWAVELRAEGMPQEEALAIIDQAKLWDAVSPHEKRFLRNQEPGEDECQKLIWRLESIWVLLWALGRIDMLDWPRGMCDVKKLVAILRPLVTNQDFIALSATRPMKVILDAQDLTMRIHWAIRDAWINHGGFLPAELDWSEDYDLAHVTTCPAVGVIEQRHYTLNWLVRFGDAEWDNVDTPT